MVKKQIDEYGEGNCCPKCESRKITKHTQYALQVEEDWTVCRNGEGAEGD